MRPSAPSLSALGPSISRRGFLIRSAGLGAALALGACAGEQEAAYRALLDPDEQPATLPVREYAVLRAAARRVLSGGPDPSGADAARVAARVDRELGFHSERLQRDFRDALRLVEWWPLTTRLTRFTRLGDAEQDAELASMATSRLAARRSAFQGLRSVLMFFYYSSEASWPGIGYDGPWVPRGPKLSAS